MFIKAFGINSSPISLSRISITDTRQIESLLNEVDTFTTPTPSERTSELSINNHIKLAIDQFKSAINLVEFEAQDLNIPDSVFPCTESMKIMLHFIVGQLTNLILSKNNRRYDILTQVFSLKIHGLSPACYRNIQSSNCLILPHERNLLHIKNTLGIDGDYFRILNEITSKFSDTQRHVILQMDEVHIRSDVAYKGCKIFGSIDNPNDPATTVFSLMVSSLMRKFSTIVRLILWGLPLLLIYIR